MCRVVSTKFKFEGSKQTFETLQSAARRRSIAVVDVWSSVAVVKVCINFEKRLIALLTDTYIFSNNQNYV